MSARGFSVSTLLLGLALAAGLSCGKGTPTAPTGTILSIGANPSTIGINGSSTITVVGRKPDGNPLIPGTEIRLSTNLGTIPSIVSTNSSGTATATLQADGRPGAAAVKATTGDGTVTAQADVQIGVPSGSKPVLVVSANPSTVAVLGSSTITVLARNSDLTSVADGTEVILTSTLGTLKPPRPTTRGGTATSVLSAGNQSGTATVSAIVGTSDATTTSVTIREGAAAIGIQANPSVIPASGGTIQLSAFVNNSQGQALQGAPVTFQADRGTLETAGVVFTNTTGVATNTLTLTQQQLAGIRTFQVHASTPNGSGDQLSKSLDITVQ